MSESSITTRRRFCTTIVYAYNEEKTLAGVLNALLGSPLVDEIIVVDDGSTDETPAILRRFADRKPADPLRAPYGVLRGKVHPIRLPENRGKGYAMAEAILNAHGEILLFVDADLLNLSPAYVTQILHPYWMGKLTWSLGIQAGSGTSGRWWTPSARFLGNVPFSGKTSSRWWRLFGTPGTGWRH